MISTIYQGLQTILIDWLLFNVNYSAISKFKLSFHYILSYYFKFQVNETGRSRYAISKYIIKAKSELQKLMTKIKQSYDTARFLAKQIMLLRYGVCLIISVVYCLEHRNEGRTNHSMLFLKLTWSYKYCPVLSEIKTGQREVKFKLVGMSKFLNCLWKLFI